MTSSTSLVLSTSKTDHTTYLWDLNTHHIVATFKDTTANPQGISLLGQDHFLLCQPSSPSIAIFHWKKDIPFYNCPVADKFASIAVTSDATYIVGGSLSGKIYLWESASGSLLKVWDAHYKRVVSIKFTDGDDFIVSGGEDSIIKVWDLCSCLSEETPVPYQTWSNHSLPITDLHCGFGGVKCLIASSSLDRTCRIWSVSVGTEIGNLVFPTSILCLALDPADSFLFGGGLDGTLFFVPIGAFNAGSKSSFQNLQQSVKAHTKQINCLRVSKEGGLLLSASDDNTVKTWDLSSQQLVRVFEVHQGPVTCLELTTYPRLLVNEKDQKERLESVRPLKKYQSGEVAATVVEWFRGELDGHPHIEQDSDVKRVYDYLTALNEQRIDIHEKEQAHEKEVDRMNLELTQKIVELEKEVARWQTLANKIYTTNK